MRNTSKKAAVIHSHFSSAIILLSQTAGCDSTKPCSWLTLHVVVCPINFNRQGRKRLRNA